MDKGDVYQVTGYNRIIIQNEEYEFYLFVTNLITSTEREDWLIVCGTVLYFVRFDWSQVFIWMKANSYCIVISKTS